MKPINPTEELLLRIQVDPRHPTADKKIFWIKEMAYPDPRNDYAAGSCCAVCPPPHARYSFVNKLIAEIKNYCEHEDGAIKVAEYIVREIRINSQSKAVKDIAERLKEYRKTQEYKYDANDFHGIMPMTDGAMPMDLGINIDHSLSKVSNYLNANLSWAWKVFKNQDWDHKPKIREYFKDVAAYKLTIKNNKSITYHHKYKDNDYFYDIWSNIHYGYVGRVAGFTEEELLEGANKAQKIDSRGGDATDTPDDKISIQIGFKLFNQFGTNTNKIIAQDILDLVESAAFTDPNTREPHWCWNERNKKKKNKRPE